jgi:2-keto-3-deoxy-L-rhamnonate aldolase RhmA
MLARTSLKTGPGQPAPLFGFFVGIPSPAVVEMIAAGGFDFVIVGREHGPIGLDAMENMQRAAEACGIATIIRVPSAGAADIMYAA